MNTIESPSAETTILYVRPFDPRRTAIAEYARHFLSALRLIPGAEVRDTLPANLTERIASVADRDAVRAFVEGFVRGLASGARPIVHVELGNALHREFWAGYYLQRLLPRARFFCTLHDPPTLCSNPYRYARTEFEGRTPFQLLNAALTKGTETLVAWRRKLVETRFLRRCEGVAVLTETAAKMLKARPLFRELRVCRLTHVFPVDAAALTAAAPALTDSPGPPPAANGADKHEMTITLFGFLNPGKRIEDLLDAFEILADRLERENAPVRQRLSIFGGVSQGFSAERWLDALRDRIRRLRHSDRIEFAPGFVSEEERDARLARADIVVLPFRATAGIVFSSAGAIRAMGLGKAIAASRADTMDEEIADEVAGLLYPEGDARALAERLYRLSVDSALRRRLGAQARRHIWSEHSPARVAEELKALYR